MVLRSVCADTSRGVEKGIGGLGVNVKVLAPRLDTAVDVKHLFGLAVRLDIAVLDCVVIYVSDEQGDIGLVRDFERARLVESCDPRPVGVPPRSRAGGKDGGQLVGDDVRVDAFGTPLSAAMRAQDGLVFVVKVEFVVPPRFVDIPGDAWRAVP
jgi:hypothetical protein